MIQEYSRKVNDLYFKLEERLGMEEAEKLIGDLDDLYYTSLGFSEEEKQDLTKTFGKETYITESYENIPKYLKLVVVRECEDDMVLCMSKAEAYYLVPKKYLANEPS